MNTVTRAILSERLASQVSLSRQETSIVIESLLEKIASVLEQGEEVKVSGFGTFSVRKKRLRVGRNPKTGEEVPILPRSVLVFHASQVLKAKMSGGRAAPVSKDMKYESEKKRKT